MEINGKKPGLKNLPTSLPASRPAERKEPLDERWVACLFAKMQARYGHRWISAYPGGRTIDIAIREWSKGLAGLTEEQISRGLEEWQGDWPPTLPEFRKACLKKTPTIHQILPALPRPPRAREIGQAAIRALREKTGRHG